MVLWRLKWIFGIEKSRYALNTLAASFIIALEYHSAITQKRSVAIYTFVKTVINKSFDKYLIPRHNIIAMC